MCNLDHWNEATVLNVSEGGLALEAIAPVNMNRPARVILDWAEAGGSIEASGEVAWNDRRRAGVRFLSMGETSRARLIEWLFQDVAARVAGRANLIAPRHPHGLTLPMPVPDRRDPQSAAPGKGVPATLHLTALLTSEHQVSAGDVEGLALLDLMAKRAQCITHASGAAIALGTAHSALCVAKSGASAPDLGIMIEGGQGLAGECLRSGVTVRCNDLVSDPRVDPATCKRLGIHSALFLPLHSPQGEVTGVLGVFSGQAYAFDDYDLATLTRMKDVIMAANQLSSSSAVAGR